jgi:hypothetical protein
MTPRPATVTGTVTATDPEADRHTLTRPKLSGGSASFRAEAGLRGCDRLRSDVQDQR